MATDLELRLAHLSEDVSQYKPRNSSLEANEAIAAFDREFESIETQAKLRTGFERDRLEKALRNTAMAIDRLEAAYNPDPLIVELEQTVLQLEELARRGKTINARARFSELNKELTAIDKRLDDTLEDIGSYTQSVKAIELWNRAVEATEGTRRALRDMPSPRLGYHRRVTRSRRR
jgi:cell fate (sporulation/competence/biofilm development) regulator YmcA (YheA/YmcA/DUF963 family)